MKNIKHANQQTNFLCRRIIYGGSREVKVVFGAQASNFHVDPYSFFFQSQPATLSSYILNALPSYYTAALAKTDPLERELITKDMLHGYVRMYLEYNRRWVETMLSAVCLLYLYVSLSSQDNSMSGEPP